MSGRNKFILTFIGADDVTAEDRTMFVNLCRVAWGIFQPQADTLRATMEDFPSEIFEVIYRPGREVLVVHVYDAQTWPQTPTPPITHFHAKIERDGQYA